MKLLCLLFSVYVILLSAKPCCTDAECQAKNTPAQMRATQATVPNTDCSDCSPFSTCSASAGFVLARPVAVDVPQTAEISVDRSDSYRQPALQQIPRVIWQPPKLG